MAHLLLMYQYMRAKRECNQLTAKSFRNQSKRKRIKNNIEKTQKYYTDAIARIKSQASNAAKMASVFYNQQAGINSQQMGGYLNYGTGAMNGWAMNQIWGQLQKGAITDKDGNELLNQDSFQMMTTLMQSGVNPGYLTFDDEQRNNPQYKAAYDVIGDMSKEDFSKAYSNFQAIYNNAQYNYQQASMWAQNSAASFQQNCSIWEEARIAELEAEQDLALEPLNYEDTMMELEDTHIQAALEEKKEEKENLKQKLAEAIKEDVPKFGLA